MEENSLERNRSINCLSFALFPRVMSGVRISEKRKRVRMNEKKRKRERVSKKRGEKLNSWLEGVKCLSDC